MAFLALCLLPAAEPFYEKGDLTYDPALVGAYSARGTQGSVTVTRSGIGGYRLALREGKQAADFEAKLFRAAGESFLDLAPLGERRWKGLPEKAGHFAVRVELDGRELRFTAPEERWLARMLKDEELASERPDPRALATLTGSTEDVRKALEWAAAEKAWGKAGLFYKR